MAHNAGFDIAFLDAELKQAAKPPIAAERMVDTLVLARRKHPGGHNTLDDLCPLWVTATRRSTLHLEPVPLAPSNIQAFVRVRLLPAPA